MEEEEIGQKDMMMEEEKNKMIRQVEKRLKGEGDDDAEGYEK
jgi:hypothetical protein